MSISRCAAIEQVKNAELMKAIKIIIRDVYIRDSITPNLIFLSENFQNGSDEFLFHSFSNEYYSMFCSSSIDVFHQLEITDVIIITDSLTTILRHKLSHNVLIVLTRCDEMSVKYLNFSDAQNVIKIKLLCNFDGNIHLVSYLFNCSTNEVYKSMNVFRNGKFAVDVRRFFKATDSQLSGCTLNVLVLLRLPFAYYSESSADKRLFGSDVRILNEIAADLDIKLNKSTNNFTSFDKFHIFVGYYTFHQKVAQQLVRSIPYDFCEFIYIVPPGDKVSSLEKLFQAFDGKTWILICLIVLVAFMSTYAVNTQSHLIRRFIFGKDAYLTSMNVLGGLLGTSSHQLISKRNFLRILWITFLLFGVLMRTLHQATLFKLLQNDENKKEIQSLDDAFERNFVVYTNERYKNFVNSSMSLKFISEDEYSKIMSNSFDSDFSGIIFLPTAQMKHFNSQRSCLKKIEFIDQPRSYVPLAYHVSKYSFYLKEMINHRIEIFQSAGLIKYWTELNTRQQNQHNVNNLPTKLTLKHVSILFYIMIIGYLVSTVIYLMEVVYFYVA